MRKWMVVAVLAGALTGVAADTYTWSTADKTLLPDDGGAVILCEDETANVTNLTISPVIMTMRLKRRQTWSYRVTPTAVSFSLSTVQGSGSV